jgi:MHS family proline/betaine transporter-like MFS transporter
MKQNKTLASAISGNILEYYDFTVYTVFVEVIGKVFFSQSSHVAQILGALAVFAVGFLARPIGGIVFGYIADKYGRRVSLITSMLGMTVPTICIGLTPGYDQIGIWAPILLIISRLVQGLCISGEGAGTAIFVLEHEHNLRPGLVSSLVHASNIVGTLIASCVGLVISHYWGASLYHWRFAFILGGIFGLCSLYLRLKITETPVFKILMEKKMTLKSPFKSVVRNSWRAMIITFFCGALTSSIVYLVKTHVKVFYHDVLHLDNDISLIYLAYSCFILMISMPLFGYLSDLIGRTKVVTASSLLIFFSIVPVLQMMAMGQMANHILALTLLGILAASISGVSYLFIISLFRPEERFSGVAFSYNAGIAFFGGTSASISRYLIEQTGLYHAPGFYIMFTAAMFLIALLVMRKNLC